VVRDLLEEAMTEDRLPGFCALIRTVREQFADELAGTSPAVPWWRTIAPAELVELLRYEAVALDVQVNQFTLSGPAANAKQADEVTLQAAHVAMLAALVADQVATLEAESYQPVETVAEGREP
jgi:hypothetical protein